VKGRRGTRFVKRKNKQKTRKKREQQSNPQRGITKLRLHVHLLVRRLASRRSSSARYYSTTRLRAESPSFIIIFMLDACQIVRNDLICCRSARLTLSKEKTLRSEITSRRFNAPKDFPPISGFTTRHHCLRETVSLRLTPSPRSYYATTAQST
jgi:hypothetical protein